MFLSRYLFLFLLLTCTVTNNTNQNELPLLTTNYKQRIKRFIFGKSSKVKFNDEELLKNYFPFDVHIDEELSKKNLSDDINIEEVLLENNLRSDVKIDEKLNGKQSQSESKKAYTQQDLAEIQRILSKHENDYYGILNIKKDVTYKGIIMAYKALALRVHPDKLKAPGATEATQRLNNARDKLLLQYFHNQNQDGNRQTTRTFTAPSSTMDDDGDQEDSDIDDGSYSISTPITSLSKKKKRTSKTSGVHRTTYYFIFAVVVLIIGIIIFTIYWKKRQDQSSSSTQRNNSGRKKIPPTYTSPESDDGNIIAMDGTSDSSIVQDEE